MKNQAIVNVFILLLFARCSVNSNQNDQNNSPTDTTVNLDIEGTWKLMSAQTIINTDTTYKDYTQDMDGVKIIGKEYFAFFQHDLSKGEDSTTKRFSSGGGKYILQGNRYTEFLEYCSSRKWEGNKFDFTVEIREDSLIQKGIEKIESLGVNRIITETYVRVNNSNSPIPILNEFDSVDWFENKGSSTIIGSAKFKPKEGEVRFGDTFGIELMPISAYTDERLKLIYNSNESGVVYISGTIPKFIPDPVGYHKTRKVTCDKNGNFEFKNLPNGTYYVIAFMIWDEINESISIKNGGGIMKRITLKENEDVTIEMSNF